MFNEIKFFKNHNTFGCKNDLFENKFFKTRLKILQKYYLYIYIIVLD